MSAFHNHVASNFRRLPSFRGKSRLGVMLGKLLIDSSSDQDCISIVRMREGSLMVLDVRSRTERWAYWTGEYDARIISKLSDCLNQNSTVLDIGANIGFYSIPWGRKLKNLNGKLYAFEPVRANFSRIVQAVELNQLEAVVTTFKVGLSDNETEIQIMIDKTDNSSTGNAVIIHGNVKTASNSVTENIDLVTLDQHANQHGIHHCDLIKIDIEGAEPMFLKGGLRFIEKHRPIIYGEFNAYWMEKFGYSLLDVADILKPLGYRFFKEVGRQAKFVELESIENGIENLLLIATESQEMQVRNADLLI
jgi:FkbM family methyltransferase